MESPSSDEVSGCNPFGELCRLQTCPTEFCEQTLLLCGAAKVLASDWGGGGGAGAGAGGAQAHMQNEERVKN